MRKRNPYVILLQCVLAYPAASILAESIVHGKSYQSPAVIGSAILIILAAIIGLLDVAQTPKTTGKRKD